MIEYWIKLPASIFYKPTEGATPVVLKSEYDKALREIELLKSGATTELYEKVAKDRDDYREQLRWALQKEDQLKRQLYDVTDRMQGFEAVLNRIGMIGSGEKAYTSDFTNIVMDLVRGVLREKR